MNFYFITLSTLSTSILSVYFWDWLGGFTDEDYFWGYLLFDGLGICLDGDWFAAEPFNCYLGLSPDF